MAVECSHRPGCRTIERSVEPLSGIVRILPMVTMGEGSFVFLVADTGFVRLDCETGEDPVSDRPSQGTAGGGIRGQNPGTENSRFELRPLARVEGR